MNDKWLDWFIFSMYATDLLVINLQGETTPKNLLCSIKSRSRSELKLKMEIMEFKSSTILFYTWNQRRCSMFSKNTQIIIIIIVSHPYAKEYEWIPIDCICSSVQSTLLLYKIDWYSLCAILWYTIHTKIPFKIYYHGFEFSTYIYSAYFMRSV